MSRLSFDRDPEKAKKEETPAMDSLGILQRQARVGCPPTMGAFPSIERRTWLSSPTGSTAATGLTKPLSGCFLPVSRASVKPWNRSKCAKGIFIRKTRTIRSEVWPIHFIVERKYNVIRFKYVEDSSRYSFRFYYCPGELFNCQFKSKQFHIPRVFFLKHVRT